MDFCVGFGSLLFMLGVVLVVKEDSSEVFYVWWGKILLGEDN